MTEEGFDFMAAVEAEIPQPPPIPSVVLFAGALDLKSTEMALAPYRQQVAAMVAEATALKVQDAAGNARATELGNMARTVKKAVEAIKQSPAYIEAKSFTKGVDNLIKSFTDPLENDVERVLKAKGASYQEQLRIEQQRKEAVVREEARKLQEKIDAEARVLREEAERKVKEAAAALKEWTRESAMSSTAREKDEATRTALQKTIDDETAAALAPTPIVVTPIMPQAETVTRTGAGSSFAKRPWKHEILDASLIPREYLVVNETAIRRAIADGIREIPGVRIFQTTEISYRG